MTDKARPGELGRWLLRPSNAILVTFLLISIAALAYGVNLLILTLSGEDRSPFAHSYLPYQIALTAFAVLFFGISLFMRQIIKTYVAIIAVSLTLSVYTGELYLQLSTPGTHLHWVLNVDSTSLEGGGSAQREMLLAARSGGREAWIMASVIGWVTRNPSTTQTEFLPFSGISRVTTVGCQEGRNKLVYVSDERGFHNPIGVWEQRDIDVLAIGDSFTIGSCVRSEENIVERIRRVHPKIINLGAGGNGSLLNLGALREFGPHLRPKIVLWFFFENDLDGWESLIVTANRYLEEPEFTQHLIERQAEIDSRWKSLLTNLEANGSGGPGALYGGSTLRSVIFLSELRRRLGITAFEGWLRGRVALTRRVVERASALTDEWGGRLIFVYLPDNYYYLANNARVAKESERIHQAVLESISDLQVDVVDMTPAFRNHPNSRALFGNPEVRSHFGPDGYALVAHTVLPVIGEILAAWPKND